LPLSGTQPVETGIHRNPGEPPRRIVERFGVLALDRLVGLEENVLSGAIGVVAVLEKVLAQRIHAALLRRHPRAEVSYQSSLDLLG
jgi:hypothetical protein